MGRGPDLNVYGLCLGYIRLNGQQSYGTERELKMNCCLIC